MKTIGEIEKVIDDMEYVYLERMHKIPVSKKYTVGEIITHKILKFISYTALIILGIMVYAGILRTVAQYAFKGILEKFILESSCMIGVIVLIVVIGTIVGMGIRWGISKWARKIKEDESERIIPFSKNRYYKYIAKKSKTYNLEYAKGVQEEIRDILYKMEWEDEEVIQLKDCVEEKKQRVLEKGTHLNVGAIMITMFAALLTIFLPTMEEHISSGNNVLIKVNKELDRGEKNSGRAESTTKNQDVDRDKALNEIRFKVEDIELTGNDILVRMKKEEDTIEEKNSGSKEVNIKNNDKNTHKVLSEIQFKVVVITFTYIICMAVSIVMMIVIVVQPILLGEKINNEQRLYYSNIEKILVSMSTNSPNNGE